MTWKFSPSTNGFYPSDFLEEYASLPTDLVDVTDAEYAALFEGQSTGKRIIAGADGYPINANQLPPSTTELAGQRDSRLAEAALRIAPLQDAFDLGTATAGEMASLTAWKQYRVAVNRVDLTKSPVTWPSQPAATA